MKQELDTTENGQKKLKWSEKIAYGFGDFGNGFMFDLGQAYLTKFYTDIALIPAGMVGVIFSITKIFDAFMDPLAAPEPHPDNAPAANAAASTKLSAFFINHLSFLVFIFFALFII